MKITIEKGKDYITLTIIERKGGFKYVYFTDIFYEVKKIRKKYHVFKSYRHFVNYNLNDNFYYFIKEFKTKKKALEFIKKEIENIEKSIKEVYTL